MRPLDESQRCAFLKTAVTEGSNRVGYKRPTCNSRSRETGQARIVLEECEQVLHAFVNTVRMPERERKLSKPTKIAGYICMFKVAPWQIYACGLATERLCFDLALCACVPRHRTDRVGVWYEGDKTVILLADAEV